MKYHLTINIEVVCEADVDVRGWISVHHSSTLQPTVLRIQQTPWNQVYQRILKSTGRKIQVTRVMSSRQPLRTA